MAQEDTSFLSTLKVWKRKSWILFAVEKKKKFWYNLSDQYKVTLHPDINKESKTLYIGDNAKTAYNIWLAN